MRQAGLNTAMHDELVPHFLETESEAEIQTKFEYYLVLDEFNFSSER